MVFADPHRHIGGVWTAAVVAEWLARYKSRSGVERTGWRECFMDPSLQAYVFEAALSRDGEEMVKHRAANAQAADMLSRVHRLQLRLLIVEPLECPDRDQLPSAADTEEGDGRVEQAIDFERVRILWRAVQTPEIQMMLDELTNIIEPRIGDHHVELIHRH